MTRLTRSSLIIGSLPLAVAFAVAISGTPLVQAEENSAPSCDCSCERYALLNADPLPQSPQPENEILQCAGACAIAWVRCEDQQLLTEAESEEGDNGLSSAITAQARATSEIQ